MKTNTQHTIECMDSWAKDKELPTYSELAKALRELHDVAKHATFPTDPFDTVDNAATVLSRIPA